MADIDVTGNVRRRGSIKALNAGYGWLVSFDTGEDYWFHVSALDPDAGPSHQQFAALRVGQSIEFIGTSTRKGPRAVLVQVLS